MLRDVAKLDGRIPYHPDYLLCPVTQNSRNHYIRKYVFIYTIYYRKKLIWSYIEIHYCTVIIATIPYRIRSNKGSKIIISATLVIRGCFTSSCTLSEDHTASS